jgi:phage shock protein PspC (stress-responsive transcriptional regulator)
MTKARLQWFITAWLCNVLAIVCYSRGFAVESIIIYLIAAGCFIKSAREANK